MNIGLSFDKIEVHPPLQFKVLLILYFLSFEGYLKYVLGGIIHVHFYLHTMRYMY